jgi:hypothetical protein
MHSFPHLKLLHSSFASGLQYLADSIREREEEPEILGVQWRRATETKESRISEEKSRSIAVVGGGSNHAPAI